MQTNRLHLHLRSQANSGEQENEKKINNLLPPIDGRGRSYRKQQIVTSYQREAGRCRTMPTKNRKRLEQLKRESSFSRCHLEGNEIDSLIIVIIVRSVLFRLQSKLSMDSSRSAQRMRSTVANSVLTQSQGLRWSLIDHSKFWNLLTLIEIL